MKIGKARGIALVGGSHSQEPFACGAGEWPGLLRAGAFYPPHSWVMNGMVKQTVYPLAQEGLTSMKINTQPTAFTQSPQPWAAGGQPQASSEKWKRKRSCFSNIQHQQKLGGSSATDDFALFCSKFLHEPTLWKYPAPAWKKKPFRQARDKEYCKDQRIH